MVTSPAHARRILRTLGAQSRGDDQRHVAGTPNRGERMPPTECPEAEVACRPDHATCPAPLVTCRDIEGTELELKPTKEVTAEVRLQIEEWIAADPKRGRAIWHNDPRGPLEWAYDGKRYRPTTIVQQILAEAADLQRNPRGPRWWRLPDGRDLPTVAGDADGAAFDWTGLHNILSHVPKGRWATYGDLAQVVVTAAQPLGQHITRCSDCPNAHRVLGSDGRPRDGFKFSDEAETRGQKEVLEGEEVGFSSAGRAEESRRLSGAELSSLLSEGQPPASPSAH